MAIDIFAKLGDIKGESKDSKHKDEIEVLSYSWGVSHPVSLGSGGAGGAAGKATFHDLSFVHKVDKSSPVLMQACATGEHLKDATITHRKAGKGQQEYLIIKMQDVFVTSVAIDTTRADGGAENVSFTFSKVQVDYKPFKSDGTLGSSVHFKYDIAAQKEG